MRAVLCSAFTGPEDLRIGEIEEPKPASDEIFWSTSIRPP